MPAKWNKDKRGKQKFGVTRISKNKWSPGDTYNTDGTPHATYAEYRNAVRDSRNKQGQLNRMPMSTETTNQNIKQITDLFRDVTLTKRGNRVLGAEERKPRSNQLIEEKLFGTSFQNRMQDREDRRKQRLADKIYQTQSGIYNIDDYLDDPLLDYKDQQRAERKKARKEGKLERLEERMEDEAYERDPNVLGAISSITGGIANAMDMYLLARNPDVSDLGRFSQNPYYDSDIIDNWQSGGAFTTAWGTPKKNYAMGTGRHTFGKAKGSHSDNSHTLIKNPSGTNDTYGYAQSPETMVHDSNDNQTAVFTDLMAYKGKPFNELMLGTKPATYPKNRTLTPLDLKTKGRQEYNVETVGGKLEEMQGAMQDLMALSGINNQGKESMWGSRRKSYPGGTGGKNPINIADLISEQAWGSRRNKYWTGGTPGTDGTDDDTDLRFDSMGDYIKAVNASLYSPAEWIGFANIAQSSISPFLTTMQQHRQTTPPENVMKGVGQQALKSNQAMLDSISQTALGQLQNIRGQKTAGEDVARRTSRGLGEYRTHRQALSSQETQDRLNLFSKITEARGQGMRERAALLGEFGKLEREGEQRRFDIQEGQKDAYFSAMSTAQKNLTQAVESAVRQVGLKRTDRNALLALANNPYGLSMLNGILGYYNKEKS